MTNLSHQEAHAKLVELGSKIPWKTWPGELRQVFQQTARMLAAEGVAPAFPPILYIEPTNACNCNCVICPRQNMTRPSGWMDMGLFQRIIESAAALGPSDVHLFNFGEPILHPQLSGMVRCCVQNQLKASLQTNGLVIDEDQIRSLLDAGLSYIGVSVNGLTAEEYEAIRPGHSFQRILQNVARLRSIIDQAGASCVLHIAAQILKNESDAREADIDVFKKTWFSAADSLSIFGLSQYEQISIYQQGTLASSRPPDMARKPDESVSCLEPFDRLVIKWDGRVTVCCVDFDAQMVVGGLEKQDLAAIWRSPALSYIRGLLRDRQYSRLPLCRSCPKFYSDPFTLALEKTRPPAAAVPA